MNIAEFLSFLNIYHVIVHSEKVCWNSFITARKLLCAKIVSPQTLLFLKIYMISFTPFITSFHQLWIIIFREILITVLHTCLPEKSLIERGENQRERAKKVERKINAHASGYAKNEKQKRVECAREEAIRELMERQDGARLTIKLIVHLERERETEENAVERVPCVNTGFSLRLFSSFALLLNLWYS